MPGASLAHLAGIHTLSLRWCEQVTDSHLAPLVHTLSVRGCWRVHGRAGMAHLRGVHTLDTRGCRVSDAGLAHLRGVCELSLGSSGGPPAVSK